VGQNGERQERLRASTQMGDHEDLPLPPPAEPGRAPGVLVLCLLVVCGMVPGVFFFRMLAPQAIAETRRMRDEAPSDPAQRAELWAQLNRAGIDNVLRSLRLSAERPWLASHGLRDPEGGLAEIWGVEVDEPFAERTEARGSAVVIRLPPPRALGRAALGGDLTRHVPLLEPGQPFDAEGRLRTVIGRVLERQAMALGKDVPGATLEIVFDLPAPGLAGAEVLPQTTGGS